MYNDPCTSTKLWPTKWSGLMESLERTNVARRYNTLLTKLLIDTQLNFLTVWSTEWSLRKQFDLEDVSALPSPPISWPRWPASSFRWTLPSAAKPPASSGPVPAFEFWRQFFPSPWRRRRATRRWASRCSRDDEASSKPNLVSEERWRDWVIRWLGAFSKLQHSYVNTDFVVRWLSGTAGF